MEKDNQQDNLIRPNVLIVDDNEKNRFAFVEILEDLDCNLYEAASGEEALRMVTEQYFALILLDVQMPGMDGFEVASLLKMHKRTADIPLVFVTAFSKEQEHIRQGHKIGAVDYIVKPVDPVVLVSKVSMYLDYYFQSQILKKQINNLNQLQNNLSQDNLQLQMLAKRDDLTGLFNRLSFNEVLKQSIHVAQQNHTQFTLLYMDLDDFKVVNDNHGHDVGDELLKIVSFRMREVLRSSDYCLPNSDNFLLARLGGDEFSVILSEVSDPSVITNIVKRLIKAFDQPLIINHLSLKVGISIGIVIFPDGGMNADDLCKNADQAMYKAKSFGKHNFHFYRFESEDSYQRNLLIESTMKRGIEDGEFYVLYQPIYQLSTQQIVGAEALCRWHHKSLGEVMPDEFIPIAESSGLIIPLGKWVLKEVIKTISKLPKSSQSSLTFSVNVSMVQFYDKEFVSFVADVLKDKNISGEMIEMEITETVISKDSFHYEGIIQQLNSMGIKLSIDDFGTGYSSLRRLHQLSISTLKIDRSFIMDIPQNEKSIKMIVSILDLAKSMNLKLIAEGIETDDQLNFLVEQKCAFGQGYFFSKPIKFSDFHSLLNKK